MEKLLADIKAGTSFVQVVPEDIGELVYFETSNPEAKPKSAIVYFLRKILVIVVMLALLAGIWWLFLPNFWLPLIATVLAAYFGYVLVGAQVFEGTDFFIGTDGYAIYEFKKTRANIISKEEPRFEDIFILLHKEEMCYKDGKYDKTNFKFTYLGKPDENNAINDGYYAESNYDAIDGDGSLRNQTYFFRCKIEDEMVARFKASADALLKAGKPVPVWVAVLNEDDTWEAKDVIKLEKGAIHFGDKTYSGEDLAKVYEANDALYFEDANLSGRFYGIEKGENLRIVPLRSIGFSKGVLELMGELYGTAHKKGVEGIE
ncbi:MAG: hypothetical protein J5764_05200 [Bacteroidales bacterium]|nr:hypothetical protein [Bacteroidales bacterium]